MPTEAEILKQIEQEVTAQGETFQELPWLRQWIESGQRYTGAELEAKLREIKQVWSQCGYALDTKGRIIGLNLSDIKFSDLTPLAGLTHITVLSLQYNQISDLTPLAYMTQLTTLDLRWNQISDLTPLTGLTQLLVLVLSNNQIGDLRPLAGLKQITAIYIDNNQINDLMPLAGLRNLQLIEVSRNKITWLPRALTESSMKINWEESPHGWFRFGLNLYANPLESPPVEIVKQGKQAVLEWFKSIEGELLPLNEVKVLLVGDGGAGKTSLVKRLLEEEFDKDEPQTHGIKITDGIIEVNNKEILLHFWDFGGQEIMHTTHQFFLSKRSLYVLVLDGRKDEKIEYWLKHIESFGGNSLIFVVLNKIDEHPGFEVNRRFLQEKYPGIQGFYRVSCATGTGIFELAEGIRKVLPQVEMNQTVWPQNWFKVKNNLENLTVHFINYNRYQHICVENHILGTATQKVLVGYLHDLGIILHFKELELLDTYVLNPKWATEAVYRIINSKQLAACKGVLRLRMLEKILRPRITDIYLYPPDKYSYIIELMKKFEICYELDRDRVLIPDLLDVQEPKFDFDEAASLQFRFQYDFLPRSILPRFIVWMHKDIKDELRWRTGVVLEDDDLKATTVVKADHEAKLILIWVNGERQREYFAVVRKTFRDIHASFEKLLVTELVPLPDYPEITVDYQELIGLERMGETQIPIGKLGKKYRVRDLLDGIERAEDRELQDLRDAKRYRLEKAHILETDEARRFQLEQQMKEFE